jgi:hypothetical protein
MQAILLQEFFNLLNIFSIKPAQIPKIPDFSKNYLPNRTINDRNQKNAGADHPFLKSALFSVHTRKTPKLLAARPTHP